jgi:hypothetical protein
MKSPPAKGFLITTAILMLLSLARAAEPPDAVSLKERVRMSTLIVVGQISKVSVFDANSLKILRNVSTLGAHQKAMVIVKVERVLYSAPNEGIRAGSHPEVVEAVFGEPGWSLRESNGATEIFFLTRNIAPQPGLALDHYPFFRWANLSVPISEEAKVTRIIAAFEAIN